jgi:hypothetical protein
MSCKLALMSAAACFVLTACNTTHKRIGQEDPFFGEAAKYNAAVQTINPDPVYPEDAAQPGDSGAKGAAAVKRYRTDQVNARHRQESKQTGLSTTGDSSSGGPR